MSVVSEFSSEKNKACEFSIENMFLPDHDMLVQFYKVISISSVNQ
jgi:hypothetical protein